MKSFSTVRVTQRGSQLPEGTGWGKSKCPSPRKSSLSRKEAKKESDISSFLDELSSLPPSVVFLFLCIVGWWRHSWLSLLSFGTLHSVGYTFPFLPCFFSFFSQPFLKPPQTTTLPSCISFSLEWFWSVTPIQYYEPLSIVLQALCLPDLIPWIYSSLAL